jgi:cyanate permease
MNVASSMGPVQITLLTYAICAVIAFGVAGIIKLMFMIIKMKSSKATAAAAAMVQGDGAAKAASSN